MKNGNAQVKTATLVKSNGDRLQRPTIEALETVQALNATIGANLLVTLLDAYHFTPAEKSGLGDDEPIASYSKAKLKAISQTFKDRAALIAHLESKIKSWRGAADLISDEWKAEFTRWALGLAPIDGDMTVVTPEGVKVVVPVATGVADTVSFLFDCLATMSNSMLFGTAAKTGKNGKAKSAKSSIFFNTKKGVETGSGDSGGENWGMRASAKYLVNNGVAGQKVCKAIELVAASTKLLNNGQTAESEKQFKILTGQLPEDKRFNFNPSLIEGLIKLRGYGLLISGARTEIKTLKDKESDAAKNAAWQNIESVELAEMVETVRRHKANESEIETIGDSHAEALDTRATLPEATQKPITYRDKAERRLRKIAADEYGRGISDAEMPLMIDDLSGSNELDEESFNDYYSEASIKEYFAEVAFKEVTEAIVATA